MFENGSLFTLRKKVQVCTNNEQYVELLQPIMDLIEVSGCLCMARKWNDKELLVRGVCHFVVLGRVSVAINQ